MTEAESSRASGLILLLVTLVNCCEACVVPASHIKSLLPFYRVRNFAFNLPPQDSVCMFLSVFVSKSGPDLTWPQRVAASGQNIGPSTITGAGRPRLAGLQRVLHSDIPALYLWPYYTGPLLRGGKGGKLYRAQQLWGPMEASNTSNRGVTIFWIHNWIRLSILRSWFDVWPLWYCQTRIWICKDSRITGLMPWRGHSQSYFLILKKIGGFHKNTTTCAKQLGKCLERGSTVHWFE